MCDRDFIMLLFSKSGSNLAKLRPKITSENNNIDARQYSIIIVRPC